MFLMFTIFKMDLIVEDRIFNILIKYQYKIQFPIDILVVEHIKMLVNNRNKNQLYKVIKITPHRSYNLCIIL